MIELFFKGIFFYASFCNNSTGSFYKLKGEYIHMGYAGERED